MSVITKLQEILPDLSKNERRIADYFLQHSQNIDEYSSEAIASICYVSRSTIIRLCHKLGYRGYSEFKYALLHEQEQTSEAPDLSFLPSAAANDVLHYYCSGLLQMEPLSQSYALSEIVDAISYANRVVALGYNHSAFSAQQFSFRLNKFGVDCHSLGDSTLIASYERILKQGDVVVIFSISGRSAYQASVNEYRKNRVKVILITMTQDCELAETVDIAVTLPHLSNVSYVHPLDDAITFYMFIEMVVERLNRKLNELAGH